MSKVRNPMTVWMAGLTAFIFVLGAAVSFKLYRVSLVEGDMLLEEARDHVIQERVEPATRGNIYSTDGQLLATSMPTYELFWDSKNTPPEFFETHVDEAAAALARVNPLRNKTQWKVHLRKNHAAGRRYIALAKNLTYSQYRRVAKTVLFDGNPNIHGLIARPQHSRLKPMGSLASRTIGHAHSSAPSGLEAFFNEALAARDGKRLEQHLGQGLWKPLENRFIQEPQNGADLITTIDSRIQDVTHRALLRTLNKYGADHGSAIVMEVATGKVRAMVNLGRTDKDSNYRELRNYAVWERTEPGSTFKVPALMVALEDGVIDTATRVNTTGGLYTIYNRKIKDSNWKYNGQGGYGVISVARALELSSNTGIVKALYPLYKDKPEQFIDRLYRLGMDRATEIEIPGESSPYIPTPEDQNWYGTTLPWMMFGYNTSCTPLQTLTFYNAIANDGTMVKPTLWEGTRRRGQWVDQQATEVLHPSIASRATLNQIQEILRNAVKRGTGRNLYMEQLPIAGKTGTCQLNYWDPETMGYQASFAGYFPADNPTYSCVVVVNRPIKSRGYYGNIVAGPVFKEVALAVNRMTATPTTPPTGYWGDGIDRVAERSSRHRDQRELAAQEDLQNGLTPSFSGFSAAEAIALLESHGIKVIVKGIGHVQRQSAKPGSHLPQTIELTLG